MSSDRKLSASALKAGALASGAALVALAGPAHAADSGAAAISEEHWSLLESHCVECHNFTDWAGGVAFDTMAPDMIGEDAEIWESVLRKLHGGLMPPPGEDTPDPAEVEAFALAMESALDHAAEQAGPRPGYVTLHRLNRIEYQNEIKALFDLDVDVEDLLPPDAESDGFTNVANVLQVSPTFLDQYIGAARQISIAAVGNGATFADEVTYLNPAEQNQNVHVAGLPLGSRGGLKVEHYFPVDGEYQFTIGLGSRGGDLLRAYPTGWLELPHTLVFAIDGKPVFHADVGGEEDMRAVDQLQQSAVMSILSRFENIPFEMESGEHTLTAAFIGHTLAEGDDILQNPVHGIGMDDVPIITLLNVIGPFDVKGVGDTPSRNKIFSCYPDSEAEQRPCAEQILTRLAEQAYRRPATHGEVQNLMGFYDAGAAEEGFETGVQKALMAMLSSTNFLYRVEQAPDQLAPGEAFALDGMALASRLSFFLWSQGPDAELRELAEAGELSKARVLRGQIDRMLADPRAEALVDNFGFQWLGAEKIHQINPDPRVFPNFDEDLREAFGVELEMFLEDVLLDDRSVLELIDAHYTFLDERLARHYGVTDVQGANFRRVELDDPTRWGLLGKGAVLMSTSYPNRTSPVLRGAWILDTLIGAPPAAPPPGVETNLDNEPGQAALTLRTRLAQHRADPSCNQCHGVIDPLGLALENFDAIGEWRDIDRFAGEQIDATGVLAGTGHEITGPIDLRNALADHPERFVQTFTESLMTYALGRRVEYYDMPVVRQIVRDAEQDGYRFSSIVTGIIEADAFRMQTIPASAEADDPRPVDEASLQP